MQQQQATEPASSKRSSPGLMRQLLLIWIAAAPLLAWAQSADIANEDKSTETGDDSSQHVEESEEAYRRRMETAESHDQADVIRPRSSGTTKVPEGIDALPADSRKHLRDELRNVIIEQGEWRPEDAGKVYPYVPSVAAETNPELRQQEEKAWGELVQEYHKREAAALAIGGGYRGGQEPGDGQDGGQGGGQQGQTAGSSGSGSGRSASSPAERAATEAASSTAAGAGVSQSALDFLKSQQGGQTGQQGSPDKVASAKPSSSPASQQPSPPEQQPQNAVAEASANKPQESKQEKSEETEPPPPPGSIAIAELVALEESTKQQAAEQASDSNPSEAAAETATNASDNPEEESVTSLTVQQSTDQPPPPPGTIAIPELEKLKGIDEAAPLAAKTSDSGSSN
ncbi:MAG TPA: hypothetical protein VFG52_10935 [Xanthomonadales bacterium]|nr:hypothetical protein [Xanthomonadales bacterium]